jgi:uncharacterized protein HemY
MRSAIIELAGNRDVFDSRNRWLDRAARVAGISSRMARRLFYCETNNPSSEVVESVRRARRNLRTKRGDEHVGCEASAEYQNMLARIERLEAALRVSDEDFNRGQIDALRDMAGRHNRPLD